MELEKNTLGSTPLPVASKSQRSISSRHQSYSRQPTMFVRNVGIEQMARANCQNRARIIGTETLPFPLLLSWWLAKVVAQQNANWHCHAIAHRRKEM